MSEVFPWQLLAEAETPVGDNGRRVINVKFLQSISRDKAKRIFGEESMPAFKPSDISPEGRVYLADARFSLGLVAEKLVENHGTFVEDQLFADRTYPDFLAHMADTISDQREYAYIMKTIDAMVMHIENIRREVLSYVEANQPIPADILKPHHKTRNSWI